MKSTLKRKIRRRAGAWNVYELPGKNIRERRFTMRCAPQAIAGEVLDDEELPRLGSRHDLRPDLVCISRRLKFVAPGFADLLCGYAPQQEAG